MEGLTDEFLDRRRAGEDLSVDVFAAEHPRLAGRIRELFPVLLLMEDLGSNQTEAGVVEQPPPKSKCPIQRLGDFRILREIGRGGMGVVYEAEQESLGRRVALKVLPKAHLASDECLTRFRREAQAAARLLHTNIVPVFGVGYQDGIHYYVMQYIAGRGLDSVLAQLSQATLDQSTDDANERSGEGSVATQSFVATPNSAKSGTIPIVTHAPCDWAKGRPAPPSVSANGSKSQNGRYWRGVAEIGVQVAEALDYAHQQGTLHRDIKPGNLLVDTGGTVWITDFGLAKLAEQDGLTQSGDVLGTLRYMAPEQFEGQSDARSDVYSLGLTLYELLTLRPAFGETSRGRLIRQVRWLEPTRPRKVNPAIPRDLETVVLKATAPDKSNRYQTAGELATDLKRFLEDRPILARRTTPVEHLWRWCRRNRAMSALAATVIASLVAVAVVASVGYLQTMDALGRVSKQRERAEIAKQDAEDERRRADIERRRAEANLRLAIRAFDDIFTQVTVDPVARPPQEETEEDWIPTTYEAPVTAKDAALLESMLSFYDQLARQNDSDLNLDMESARARRRVGDIHRRLGQYENAEEAYRRALELYGQLAQTADDGADHALRMAAIHNELGIVHERTGRMPEARDSHLEAERILAAQAEQIADSPECRFELARTYNFLGSLIVHRGQAFGPPEPPGPRSGSMRGWRGPRTGLRGFEPGMLEHGPPIPPPGGKHMPPLLGDSGGPGFGSPGLSGGRYHQLALDILEDLLASHPRNPEYRLAAAQSYRNLMVGKWRVDSSDAVHDARKEAVRILEELVSDFPANPDYAYELAETYAMTGPGHRGDVSHDDALERLTKAVEIGANLVERFPNVPEYAASLARAHVGMARLLVGGEARDRANEHFDRAIRIERALVASFPSVPDYRASFSRTLHQSALLERSRGSHEAARQRLKEAVENWEAFAELTSGRPVSRMMLAQLYRDFADTLRLVGEVPLADATAKKLLKINPRGGPPPGRGGPGFREGRATDSPTPAAAASAEGDPATR